MRTEDRALGKQLSTDLRRYSEEIERLPGIEDDAALNTFIFQVIESIRRIRFIEEVAKRDISSERRNPASELFDPIRAAILEKRAGNFEEACWLVFLFTHFGKNLRSGYRLLRDVYGRLGEYPRWTWDETRNDAFGFRRWLDANLTELRSGAVHRAFGNHRKYQSLDPWKANGTGAAIESYVIWVMGYGSHQELFQVAAKTTHDDSEKSFRYLYESMTAVISFGRTARFDYLSMIGKLKLANIRPDSVHLGSATGPVDGASLLFGGSQKMDITRKQLETSADQLSEYLHLDKQIMEDSLCNWQKSPTVPIAFRG
ncbi:hypothetical protein ACFPT7_09440 [Acidicapsa dinghuensis]|uniref:Alpha-glutamyl/putrescinyl thymine pyrophosphorylase clade 3 domain-containing protein n=1 Tax=Acidicapsa dinghuensis TaxID=2218256 RepID=A0ABW1EDY0_9BACT|nr:hypothetical protein [Acidicapsa dinghuensis]